MTTRSLRTHFVILTKDIPGANKALIHLRRIIADTDFQPASQGELNIFLELLQLYGLINKDDADYIMKEGEQNDSDEINTCEPYYYIQGEDSGHQKGEEMAFEVLIPFMDDDAFLAIVNDEGSMARYTVAIGQLVRKDFDW